MPIDFKTHKDLDRQKVEIISKNRLDESIREEIKSRLEHFIEYYDQKFGPETLKEFKINITETHKKGKNIDFEVHANLFTDFGHFHAIKEGWKVIDVFDEVTGAVKRQLQK